MKGMNHLPNNIDGQDPHEDLYCSRTFDEVVNCVKQQSKEENIDYVNDLQREYVR
jgi:hypothetical protein